MRRRSTRREPGRGPREAPVPCGAALPEWPRRTTGTRGTSGGMGLGRGRDKSQTPRFDADRRRGLIGRSHGFCLPFSRRFEHAPCGRRPDSRSRRSVHRSGTVPGSHRASRPHGLEVARYHGGCLDGPCVRCRLRCSLTHLEVRSLACSPPPSPGSSGHPRGSTTAHAAARQDHGHACSRIPDKPPIRAACDHRRLALLPPVVFPPEEVNLMVESRWLRWIGPGVVALGAVGFIASTTLGAGVRPWVPSACAGPPTERIAAARERAATAPADLRGAPWFRLDPVLDDDGSAQRPAARPRARRRADRPVHGPRPGGVRVRAIRGHRPRRVR